MLQAADDRDYFLKSQPTRPQSACWIFTDIMFAHNVPAYTATRKWRVLKVTPQVATPGAESAVYDCLVGSFSEKQVSKVIWLQTTSPPVSLSVLHSLIGPLYNWQAYVTPQQKCPFPWGIKTPIVIQGPARFYLPNGISIGSAVLHSTAQYTDHSYMPHASQRPRLRTACVWCGSKRLRHVWQRFVNYQTALFGSTK